MDYSTFDAAEILKIDYSRLNEWLRGYFTPMQRASGRGTRTRFSTCDLYRLKVFALLVDSGISRDFSSEICKGLQEKGADFSDGYLIAAKGAKTGAFMYLLTASGEKRPLRIKNVEKTSADGKMDEFDVFPAQLSIHLPSIKKLVDDSLP